MSEMVTMYKTDEGKLYATKAEADLNEAKEELLGYVDRFPIHGNVDGCTIYGDLFSQWLKDNPRIYIQLLPEEHNDGRS